MGKLGLAIHGSLLNLAQHTQRFLSFPQCPVSVSVKAMQFERASVQDVDSWQGNQSVVLLGHPANVQTTKQQTIA